MPVSVFSSGKDSVDSLNQLFEILALECLYSSRQISTAFAVIEDTECRDEVILISICLYDGEKCRIPAPDRDTGG